MKKYLSYREYAEELFNKGIITEKVKDLIIEEYKDAYSEKITLSEAKGTDSCPPGPGYADEPRSKEGNFTSTNPSKSWILDANKLLSPINSPINKELSISLPEELDYFLVETVIGEGTAGERREQKVMTREEANNVGFWGYKIIKISRIY